jgi:hypothetical protein
MDEWLQSHTERSAKRIVPLSPPGTSGVDEARIHLLASRGKKQLKNKKKNPTPE